MSASRVTEPSPAANLRSLITAARADHKPLVLPGCYDALGARLIELAGFDGVYMTGFGTSAGLLGQPDVGLLGLQEMVDNARRVAAATHLPVLADADTGYGNAINVAHTVRSYEQAGVAGLHIEDQVMPKKCGHMANKAVIDADEMVSKVRAAVDARTNADFVITARTDARAPHGLDQAIERAHLFKDAGADVLFIEALTGVDEIERVASEFNDTPLLFNWVEGGKTPALTYHEIAELGFAIIIMPIGMLLAATAAMQGFLHTVKHDGTPAAIVDDLMSFGDFTDLIGLPQVQTLEQHYRA